MNKNNILITLKKELRSIFRDKKTIKMIFGFPFIIAFMIFLMGFMEESMMGESVTEYNIGVDYEINEVEEELFKQYNFVDKYFDNFSDMQESYNDKKIDAYISYDSDANNYVVYANSDISGMTVSGFIMNYLNDYNQYLGNLKLVQNNIDPSEVYSNFTYEMKNVTGEELNENTFMIEIVMDISFTYIIMAIAMAAVNMATSAIAVEKENGTLETILTLPITTGELIVGKYLSTVVVGIFSSMIGFLLTIISFAIAKNMFTIYSDFTINFIAVFFGIIICIVASFLISGVAILLTSSAKTYKEAQAKGQVLSTICIFPIFMSYLSISVTEIYYAIPVLNFTSILMDLYSNNLEYVNLFITLISTVVYVAIILFIVLKKFKSEKILFGA